MAKIPKVWARLVSVSGDGREVTFVPDGKSESVTLPLNDDAQVHARAFFASPADLVPEERVWGWLDFDRREKWTGIRVLADELSGRRLHGKGSVVKELDKAGSAVRVEPPRGEAVVLRVGPETCVHKGEVGGRVDLIEPGMEVFYQEVWTASGWRASLIADTAALEPLREASRRRAEERS